MDTARQEPSALLAKAATAAGYAPSILNTQPWRWRVHGDVLELYADPSRQMQAVDPDGRLLVISCGAALHHAALALAAEGVTIDVELVAEGDLLARISVKGHREVTGQAMRAVQDMRLRHTDRRPVFGPADPDAVAAVRQAGTTPGVDVHLLRPEQVSELGVAAAHADRTEILDPQQRAELAYWVGGERPDQSGVPLDVVPPEPSGGPVPGRDYVRAGTLDVSSGNDAYATYLMLFGPGDEPADWLRAGQALSSAWLKATELGLSVLPFSSVVEVAPVRERLAATVLSGLGHPYLVLRLGALDPEHRLPPHTPRLPADQIVELG
ncbi:nitroreductase [Hamadaea sp. NPDC050747]|uniref:Acg family FMN-binding oxidoreductase n=1 Tax=Hamadaea sp. NPDC050747 TaxID=3155789 RepID=UPI0033E52B01